MLLQNEEKSGYSITLERILKYSPGGKPYYSVGYKKQQNDLPKTKEKYPKYKAVYSKVLQMAIRTLNADYNSFFEQRKNGDLNAHPPGFKGKDHFTTMMYNQSGFSIKGIEQDFYG